MSTEGTRESPYATFDALIPGCNWEIFKPYDQPVSAGIHAEQARLAGKRWLVAALIWSMGYDTTHEEILLDAAFDDPDEAWERAQQWQQELIAAQLAANGGECGEPQPPWSEWPGAGKDAIAAGPIRRLPPCGVYREYWDYNRIHVAVLPLDPAMPVSSGFLRVIDKDDELKAHFRKIGESLGFDVHRPPRIAGSAVQAVALPKPSSPFKLWLWRRRWSFYWLGVILASMLYLISR
jgi:hypothetical protein